MIDRYQRFHASCMREEQIAPGPGELIICLREPIFLKNPSGQLGKEMTITLVEGTILHSDIALRSVRAAVSSHLNGQALQSEVRFGAGIFAGLEAAMRAMTPLTFDQEKLIDDWLDRYALFVFQHHAADDLPHQPPDGLFNGILAHWHLHWAASVAPTTQPTQK